MNMHFPKEGYQIARERIAEAKAERAISLNLSYLMMNEIPEEIVELKDHLKVLSLGPPEGTSQNNKLQDFSLLPHLTSLIALFISEFDYLTDLRCLKGLTSLKRLELSYSKNLSDLTTLKELKQLVTLDLSHCKNISDLTPLENLHSLKFLNLSHCDKVTNLIPLENLEGLKRLELDFCTNITDIPDFGKFTSLEYLELYFCNSNEYCFPQLILDLPNLSYVGLCGATFLDIPYELIQSTDSSMILEEIRSHFIDMKNGSCLDREINVLVLGNIGSGKSSLCKRLVNNEFNPDENPIHQTSFWRWKPEQDNPSEEQIIFNIWDFGAHDIYYASYRMFHERNTVIIICWNNETENQEPFEDESHGLSVCHQQPGFWPESLRPYCMTSPVIVVQTKCRTDSEFEEKMVKDLGDFHCRFSAESNDLKTNNRNQLVQCLKQAALLSLGPPERQKIGKCRWKVRQELVDLMNEGVQRISFSDFDKLCDKYQVRTSYRLLDYLAKAGKLMINNGLIDKEIILDKRWLCELVDAVYNPKTPGHVVKIRDNGIREYDYSRTAYGDFPPEVQQLFSNINIKYFQHLLRSPSAELFED